MKQEIKQLFPSFCNSDDNHDLILSDDIDSLLSCLLLKKIKGYRINYFYNWTEFYRSETTKKKVIGVDVDFHRLRCWSNHVTILSEKDKEFTNNQSANLNNVLQVNRDNYKQKWAGSTLLQIMSYYDVPLPASDQAKMLLLAVDTTFKGYYNPDFKNTLVSYLEMLEFEELIDILKQCRIDEFYKLIETYNLHIKIFVNELGFLDTEIDLTSLSDVLGFEISLPWSEFKLVKMINKKGYSLHPEGTYDKGRLNDRLFSLALVKKNFVIMNHLSCNGGEE